MPQQQPQKYFRKKIFSIVIAISLLALLVLLFFSSPLWVLHKVEVHKRSLQTRSDLPAIRDACLRLFAAKSPASTRPAASSDIIIPLSDPDVPPLIRDLKPHYIGIARHELVLSWGGRFIDSYGYYATTQTDESNVDTSTDKKLVEGLYFWTAEPAK